MKRRTLYMILGAAVVVIVIGVLAWRVWLAAQPEGEIRSAVVERGTMLVTVSVSGRVEPQARVSLAFETSGRVAEVAVEVGDAVQAGDVLARLDDRKLALQVQQAQAAVTLAEAQLAQLQSGPRAEEIASAEASVRAVEGQVGAAAANLDQLEAGPEEAEVATAQADLAAAISQQRKAQDTYDLVLTCVGFRLPNGEKQEICPALGAPEEQARYNLQAADKALAAAQARFDELAAGANTDQVRAARANVAGAAAQRDAAQAQLDLLRAGATGAQIADAEAQVAQAQAGLEQAQLALERATLRAPFEGVVAQVNLTAGEMARMGTSDPAGLATGVPAGIVLLDVSRFHVAARVDEIEVGRLAEGQVAQVTLDALPEAVLTGTVERIAPVATPESGVVYYDVTIRLAPTSDVPNKQSDKQSDNVPVRADMTANATIIVEELADVLTIPTWVVRVDRSTGQAYVDRWIGNKRSGGVERVNVQLGVRYEGVAQVLDGLAEGDEVVLVPDSMLFGSNRPFRRIVRQ